MYTSATEYSIRACLLLCRPRASFHPPPSPSSCHQTGEQHGLANTLVATREMAGAVCHSAYYSRTL